VKSKIGIVVDDSRWRDILPDAVRVCRRAARSALAELRDEGQPVQLCVMLADDETVADLNKRFRGKRGPTNVLSFSGQISRTPASPNVSVTLSIGDIVLAFETVVREAQRDGKTISAHVSHLVVHGVLHLLGHDHTRQADASRMESLEVTVLARLGVGNPYA
jgi:probable rRNA maturation factor